MIVIHYVCTSFITIIVFLKAIQCSERIMYASVVSFIEPQKGYRKTTREYHPKEIHDEILPLSMDLITKRLFFHVTTGRNQTIAKRVGLIMSSLTLR